MGTMLLVGVCMSVLSATFWCIEAMPFVRSIRALKSPEIGGVLRTFNGSIRYIVEVLKAVLSLWPLALDLLITLWLAGTFAVGGAVTGAIIGLAISNVISIFLLKIRK